MFTFLLAVGTFAVKGNKLWQYILSLIIISAHVPLTAAEKYGEKTVAHGR